MTVNQPTDLAGVRHRQVDLLTALVAAGQRLRTAIVARDFGAMLDVAGHYEDLLDALDGLESDLQSASRRELSVAEAAACDRLQPRITSLMTELQSLQSENRHLLRQAHEQASFRLQLITGGAQGPVHFVDRRV